MVLAIPWRGRKKNYHRRKGSRYWEKITHPTSGYNKPLEKPSWEVIIQFLKKKTRSERETSLVFLRVEVEL